MVTYKQLNFLVLGILSLLGWLVGTAAADQSFTGLGDLPGRDPLSTATDVSANGSTAVGDSSSTIAFQEPFRWTQVSGMVGLGPLSVGSLYSTARGVSSDGSIIVGQSESASGFEAFRWTSGGGMIGLGDLVGGSFYSDAIGVSDDGSTVVGESESTTGSQAFVWSSGGGMVGLGHLPGGGSFSNARGVSADGSSIVGESDNTSGTEAFLFTSGGGMIGLGHLPGGSFSAAYDISSGGSSVVGESESATGFEAFLYTSAGGMSGLGHFPGGSFSGALGISGDGSTVVGFSDDGVDTEAFIWDASNGMRKLSTVLSDIGLDLAGWTLYTADGISADGTVIVGNGSNPSGNDEAWMAVIEGPPDPDRFFIYLNAVTPEHEETDVTAAAYHAAIDPNDERLVLSDWLTVNGFDGGATAEATYVNQADLGFGRHMFIRTEVGGRVASYVKNHGDNSATGAGDDPVDGTAEEKIANAHSGVNLIATVAMEYGPPPNDPFGVYYTKFYAFDKDGNRIIKANLDGRGEKHLPGVCTVCHGGNPLPLFADGGYPNDGNTGAGFLPWDLDTFGFSDTLYAGLPIYDRPSQEAAFKNLNVAVLGTNPTTAAREVIEGWYGGGGLPNATFDGSVVPAGWSGHESAYREIYAPNCRACHIMRNQALAFQTHAEFVNLRDRASHLVFERGIMPLARRTYDRFWDELSVSDPALVDLFGAIPVTRRPGGGVPIAFAGPDRAAMAGVAASLDGSQSSYSTSFQWSVLSAPLGSTAVPVTPNTQETSFVPDLPGTYVFELTTTNDQGNALDTVTVIATANGENLGVDFATEVLPIFVNRCKTCHDGSFAPDFDGVGVSQFSSEYAEVVYRNFARRVSVIDPSESLLLQKSLALVVSHGGGLALSGPGEAALVARWIAEGAVRVTTPSYQKTSGAITQPIKNISGDIHLHRGADLGPGAVLSGIDLESAFLVAADLSGSLLDSVDFYNSNLTFADLSGADLTGADLGLADLTNADLSNAIGLTPAQIESAVSLYGVKLDNLDLAGINLAGRSLATSSFSAANLFGSDLSGADFSNANLSATNLSGANLTNATDLDSITGSPLYDMQTNFTGTGFDPVSAGWVLDEPNTIPTFGPVGLSLLWSFLVLIGWHALGTPNCDSSRGKL